MKTFLSIIGSLFLVLIVVVASFIGYAAYQGTGLDKASKIYVENNVPLIISTWSKDELLNHSSPQLLRKINEDPERFSQLFELYSKLGKIRSFGNVEGDSNISYSSENGKVTTAGYMATAIFENGDAQISVKLIQLSDQWQFLSFYVDSPLFLQGKEG
ncbi:hypothetical protein L4D77_28840 [Photobacterium frigidiphilum]|uniref:hypothetical protein n=1 Tax=Photobacterium frigidiphilum TaxID=264736 RepID=UPI003D116F33